MRKHYRWLVGAVLILAAVYGVGVALSLQPVKPVYAQTGCTPNGSVGILNISPSSVYNSGPTNLTILGTGFEADVNVVVLGYGALATTYVNGTTLTAVLPAGVPGTPNGSRYGILVYNTASGASGDPLQDCSILNDGLAVYSAPTAPAATAAPTAFIRPLVSVQSYDASAKVLYPGQNVDFSLTLQNTGPINARNVTIEFSGTDLLPRDTGGLRAPGDIAAGGTLTLSQPLRVSSSLSGYQAVIAIKINYTDDYGAKYSDNSTLSFAAGQYAKATPTLSLSPQLILGSYQTDPAVLSPGTVFKLSLSLANVSSMTARQVVIDLGGSSGSSSGAASTTSSDVAPLNSSNLRYVDLLQAGQQVPLSFDMAVSGDASSALANLNVAISYIDDSNTTYSQNETISLRIETKALFLIHFFNALPDLMTVGDNIELPVEVINIGTNSINVSIVELTSDQMTITDGSSYFGPLDGGTSGTLLAKAQLNRAGPAAVTVNIHYLDDFQQQQTYTYDLTFDIQAVEVTPQSNGSGQDGRTGGNSSFGSSAGLTTGQRILRLILGFFGVATQDTGGGGFNSQFPGGAGGAGGTPFFGGAGATPAPSGGNAP